MSELKVPFDRSKTWPLALVVVLNLIPVAGVIFWGWSAFALIVLYWLENLVIGVRTLASMFASAAMKGGGSWLGTFFTGAFFVFHYGLFCFVHGIFVMALFGSGAGGDSIVDLAGAVGTLFATQTNLLIGFASIVAWQVVQFIRFLVGGDVRASNAMELMASPYPRIAVLHMTILLGGFVLLLLNQPVAGIVVLALIKAAYDIADVLRDPRPLAESAVSASTGARPQ